MPVILYFCSDFPSIGLIKMKCSNWIKTQNPKDDFEGMIKHLFMASTPAKKKSSLNDPL